ncbi:MAG: primase C-terminal domain-containing protein [Cyclobacteriaceae bacterium]|nr:primase C-terminal domain-containing protein [Cyclobacteriaceae bacterium]MBX2944919.1 primase C-terminal domain-containing protein [Cyclobacteriaceae bacterium]MBX2958023.1 primase C-terminal domain-containing protein [Cyclobacteriaceae bacterium]
MASESRNGLLTKLTCAYLYRQVSQNHEAHLLEFSQ